MTDSRFEKEYLREGRDSQVVPVPDGLVKIVKNIAEKAPTDSSINNGGSTNYYKFNPTWVECADVIEGRKMNYNQGNIFKSAFTFNIGRHAGTDYERELNKIIYFAQRELEQIKEK